MHRGRGGGTWWYNRYPGVACDVPSHLYSYSFFQVGTVHAHCTGGGWYNRYPGVACDVPSYLYNYSFFQVYSACSVGGKDFDSKMCMLTK